MLAALVYVMVKRQHCYDRGGLMEMTIQIAIGVFMALIAHDYFERRRMKDVMWALKTLSTQLDEIIVVQSETRQFQAAIKSTLTTGNTLLEESNRYIKDSVRSEVAQSENINKAKLRMVEGMTIRRKFCRERSGS